MHQQLDLTAFSNGKSKKWPNAFQQQQDIKHKVLYSLTLTDSSKSSSL
jgi:hypothetical protein